jgi:hypothetical protein
MRAFKNKWFHRWAHKEGIPDKVLLDTAKEIIEGKVEADLGGSLFKKRIARRGSGKSGGYRTIVGYKKGNSKQIIFLYGFGKKDKGNITAQEEAALSIVAENFLSATDSQVNRFLAENTILEVSHE